MAGMNVPGISIPNMGQPPQMSPYQPSYGGSGTYNQMAWNSSPLSRNPYSNPMHQPRPTWYGRGGYMQQPQSFIGSGGSGDSQGGPLTSAPFSPSSWGGASMWNPYTGGGGRAPINGRVNHMQQLTQRYY